MDEQENVSRRRRHDSAGARLIVADARDVAAAAGALQAGLDDADRRDDGAPLAALAHGEDVAEAAGELGKEAAGEELRHALSRVEAEDVRVASVEDDNNLK